MSKGAKVLIVVGVWLFIGLGISMAVKWVYYPAVEQAEVDEKDRKHKEKLAATSGTSNYKADITCRVDGFSGYSVLRSQEMKNELRRKGLLAKYVDDGADYDERLKALSNGDAQLAVFTIDALIKSSEKINDIPGVIVALIDETQGADAMVAYKEAFPNVDSLNDPETKFILVGDSPAETLARVLISHFNLNNLSEDPFVFLDSAEEVYKKYRTANPKEKQVFVLWEPYVTKALENPNMHVVIDSSRFRGYIVDVLVAQRDFLYKEPEKVRNFVESYFRATYKTRGKMAEIILQDARALGTPVTQQQSENLEKGIWFKNTQENYSHFGFSGDALQHVEDMILNLTNVLTKSGSISKDPTGGDPTTLYYEKILKELYDSNFHPGVAPESIRNGDQQLAALTDSQWGRLIPVGTLEVPKLSFARGTANLSGRSSVSLDVLLEKLKTFPQYYVIVRGDSTTKGDIEANKKLALKRAQAAADYLVSKGIHKNRVKAESIDPSGVSAVNFILGETPY
ncbi:MAG: phosphate ABC transporter substrate-binding/OmpA family protein [Candidatus Thorarchaeota archaeon]|jgi:outer membrane protein OmpA-like peptidoglycan-associated protein